MGLQEWYRRYDRPESESNVAFGQLLQIRKGLCISVVYGQTARDEA